MADYWKSQPRKFCQYCKCWIADNKPSVEFHERGKNHKENVAAKISEIKKKSLDKAKQDEKNSKQFAAMEEAAMKAYQEDLKRMEMEAAGVSLPAPTTTIPRKPPPQAKPKKQQKKEKASKMFRERNQEPVWVEGQSDDGHTYYYNSVTGESRWETPEGFQGHCSTSAQPAQMKSSSAGTWMEAFSPEGYTYYYNTETGESSWEKPGDFPSIVPPGTESNWEGERQKEPSTPQPEPPSGEEEEKESSNGTSTAQEPEVPEQTGQQQNVPKISFRKRQAEAESSEKEGEDEKVGDDDAAKKDDEETKKEEEVPSTTAEPEGKKEEEVTQKVTLRVTPAKRPKAATPYGVWEQIQEEKDPYASVDLQLPQWEGGTVSAPSVLPPEPKPKFKERIITSLGEEGGSTSFRKNKTQNGKSRSIRQRDNDD
ncbi:WW domain-binding protein 4 [Labrus mixtus]|uniref:WW domain-binding protein 4 n=1 Tax=Labrus mixtus TaxID=508554 RepID=UPI0029BFCECF|nr:WW domain-binding protein 4 [Labrus mixtus]